MNTFTEIWLLCRKDWEKKHFTKGMCYKGDRLDSDTWSIKNNRNKIVVLSYSEDILTYFHHAFFYSDFKNVCNDHPELIDPKPYEWDVNFKWYYDMTPDSIKSGQKTVDAVTDEEAEEKIIRLWPNVHDIQLSKII